MRRFLAGILLLILIPLHIFALGKATEAGKLLPKEEDTTFVIPSPILRITALEFRGLASDFMFLKALVFVGSTFERKERPRVKAWEWRWVYNVLDASMGLDPYFYDPYYFANANLTWDAGLVGEANRLLEKGSRFRDWDWTLPFYLGFNNFYFLHENEAASKFLMEAARRGGSPMLASLASKLAYKERRTENAIIFLEEIIKKTDSEDLKKEYETRLEALRGIELLENAVGTYREKFRSTPHSLDALITKRIITEIPKDPYGGKFYIDSQGVVKSTSDEKLMPYIRK